MATEVWIGLGSNSGDRLSYLRLGLTRLAQAGDILRVSSVYQTEPWGKTDQPDFFNMVCSLSVDRRNPEAFWDLLKNIEEEVGRDRGGERWGPRRLDLDVLFWGEEVFQSPQLTVPHPRIPQRRFVLEPLVEISPHLRHPISGLTAQELLHRCPDSGKVIKLSRIEVLETGGDRATE